MALPQRVKDLLIKRDTLDVGLKKSNEYRIREYIKNYLNDLEEILWVLDRLPGKQSKKLYKDEDVYRLLELTERALVTLDFMPIQRNEEGRLVAMKSLEAIHKEGGSPRSFSISHEATDLDKNRFSALQKHIARLEKFVQSRQGAIYNDLDKVYLKDPIAKAKKEGYEPATVSEREQYIPRLTPEQYHFQEVQGILTGLGFRNIEYPADVEILREALHSEEGKALKKKFDAMQAQPPK